MEEIIKKQQSNYDIIITVLLLKLLNQLKLQCDPTEWNHCFGSLINKDQRLSTFNKPLKTTYI